MDLKLRKANESDMDLLFMWANDKTVRQNAFHTEQIPYENHVKWFNKMMEDVTVYQYILCDENDIPLGQIRLNIEDKRAVIDYSISEQNRKKGYGSQMLKLIEMQIIQDNILNVTELIGQVKYENKASAHAFEKCGYEKSELKDYIQYRKGLTYEDNNSNH